MTGAPLLEVRNLTTSICSSGGAVTVVDQVSFSVAAGRSLALVGESGSGKSMTCASILRLLPPSGRIEGGQVRFHGQDLLTLPEREIRRLRGRRIGMILQDAMTSLNPIMTIGDQLGEVFRRHHGVRDRAERRRRAVAALEAVEITGAAQRLDSYPFQLSGGMRQRVCIAINIACAPDLLLCDEPTTALDATVQQQILGLLKRLQRERGLAIIFVTHDLRLAAQFCDEVAVMYAGRIVETGPIGAVFAAPAHPYAEGLLAAAPELGAAPGRLAAIPGTPPAPGSVPVGCRFAPRCTQAEAICSTAYPDWFDWQERSAACWLVPKRLAVPARVVETTA